MASLKITTFQAYLYWENPEKNLQNLALRLSGIREKTDLIVLPEMFNTGFTMNPELYAEPVSGKTMTWMHEQAKKFNCVVAGSLAIKEDGNYFNRLIWMRADGSYDFYDKRHLFTLGGEDNVYTAGVRKVIVELHGWKINLAICYDLRFPVWLRNVNYEYDLLLLVANWPDQRSMHWRTLIPARAIENQAYVIGVNRVGHDGNEVYHAGDSMCIDPEGKTIYYKPEDQDLYTFTIHKEPVTRVREHMSYLPQSDHFQIL